MKYFDLFSQYKILEKSIKRDIDKIFNKSNFINGEEVYNFEKKLSEYTNSNAITCANGTDAIYLSLLAIGCKSGDYILSSNFNYISTVECCKLLGLKIILLDIDETLTISLESLNKTIKNCKVKKIKPKALISVNLFGNSINYQSIGNILKKEKILHISDCAQSFGSKYKNKSLESYALISTTSFFPSKSLGCYGDGGAIFSKSNKIIDYIKSLKSHGCYKNKYNFRYVGINSRLDTIQAAILNSKMKLLDKEIEIRNKNYDNLRIKLNKKYIFPSLQDHTFSCISYLNLYSNIIPRKKILNELKKFKIPYQIYYPKTIIEQKPYSDSLHFGLEFSKKISKKIFSIPFHSYIKKSEINKIANLLNSL